MKKGLNFLKNSLPIILVVLLSAFLRFYDMERVTAFLGDQGRDMLIAKDILEGKLTLLGPPTSISDVHFGPFYHYFNALFLYIFNLDPIGPPIGFALLSILATYLLYSVSLKFGYKMAGILSALFYTISPLMIRRGRTMFNSYLVSGFSIISFWCFSEYSLSKRLVFLPLSGMFLGLAIQANFLAVGLFIAFFVLFLKQKIPFKKQLYFYFGFLMAIFPYVLFELRHQFFNSKEFLSLFQSGGAVSSSVFFSLKRFLLIFWDAIYYAFSYRQQEEIRVAVFSFIICSLILGYFLQRKKSFLRINFLFIFTSLAIISFYPGEILDHYLGSVYPFLFWSVGIVFWELSKTRIKPLFYLLILGLLILNFSQINFSCKRYCLMPQGWDMNGVKEAGRIISQDASDDYNVAAILDGDTRAYPYRYIIEIEKGKPPLGVEKYPQARTLYVVARGDEGYVLSYPVWEISSILPAKITKVWPIKNGISVFKLERI